MNNTETATQAVAQVVSPLFVDCLNQLGSIKNQLSVYYAQSKLLNEMCNDTYFDVESSFYDLATQIGEMAKAELVENTLYHK